MTDALTRRERAARRAAAVVLLTLVIAAGLWVWLLARPHVLRAYEAVPVMRLHVVPHSDAPRDQDMKLAVRDAVVPLILALVQDADSPDEAQWRLLAARDEIVAAARRAVRERGADYPVAVVGQWNTAGEPVAVHIRLGDGRGRNWFCVLFPPLCFAEGAEPAAAAPLRGDTDGRAVPETPVSPTDGVQVALRVPDWLPGLAALLVDGFGQVDQDDVHTDFAHALPRDGHIGTPAE